MKYCIDYCHHSNDLKSQCLEITLTFPDDQDFGQDLTDSSIIGDPFSMSNSFVFSPLLISSVISSKIDFFFRVPCMKFNKSSTLKISHRIYCTLVFLDKVGMEEINKKKDFCFSAFCWNAIVIF